MFATEVFALHAARFRDEPLSADVLHHAKRAVIDWYASLYPGLDAPAVQGLEAVLSDDLDRGAARLARGVACWLALTAVLVMAWKLASATSAACLAALCTLS